MADLAATKASKSKSRAYAVAKRDAEAAQRKADALKRVAEELEAEDLALERAREARGDLAGALYDLLGVEPEPKRETSRTVQRRGKNVQESVLAERDPKEVQRAGWTLEAVELMAERLGDENMAEVMQIIERRREGARKADDAKRVNKGARASAGESVSDHGGAATASYTGLMFEDTPRASAYAVDAREAA